MVHASIIYVARTGTASRPARLSIANWLRFPNILDANLSDSNLSD